MTTKAVISIMAAMWELSLILIIMITIIAPVNIVWPLALIYYNPIVAPFFVLPQLTTAVFITITSAFCNCYIEQKSERE